MDYELLKTRKQVAAQFSVDPLTVRRWELKGLIVPQCHINGRPRYSAESLKELSTNKNNKNG